MYMTTDYMKHIENKLEVMCAQMSQLASGGKSPVTGVTRARMHTMALPLYQS
jgi:hypothetical protein